MTSRDETRVADIAPPPRGDHPTHAGAAVRDRYPTRCSQPSVSVRHDPVVHGSAPGPLDPSQRASYEADGYLGVDRLLTDTEVEALRGEVDRLCHPPSPDRSGRTVCEPGGDEVRSVFDVHRTSEVVAEIVADERLAGVARQLLGSDVYIHQSRVNLKPGFVGKEFAWHSDFETWHAEDGMPAARAVSLSIALTANYECNGSLMLIPGSHRSFVATAASTPRNHFRQSLRRQEVGVPDEASLSRLVEEAGRIAVVTGPPGSAVWFDCNVMHGSSGNITPYPRCNLFVVYNSVHNVLVEPFAAPGRRPEFVAGRDFTPVSRR